MSRYQDRRHAGRVLAGKLTRYVDHPDLMVLALPRGGVPVGYEVARRLGAPLDVFVVRKLGLPGHEELALGAIASGGIRVLNEDLVRSLGIDDETLARVAEREGRELARRERQYRGGRAPLAVRGRTIILVDDGLATGASMRAAIVALKTMKPARLVAAVPIAAPETCAELCDEVDEMVCAVTPEPFYSVGLWYADFSQTSDEEVHELLDAGESHGHSSQPRPRPSA